MEREFKYGLRNLIYNELDLQPKIWLDNSTEFIYGQYIQARMNSDDEKEVKLTKLKPAGSCQDTTQNELI